MNKRLRYAEVKVTVEGCFNVHSVLRNLYARELLNNGYMVYERDNDTRVVLGKKAQLVVSGDEIVLSQNGRSFSERCKDPIKQMQKLMSHITMEDWTAYGYVAFDIVKYYFDYDKVSRQPEMYFFIPQHELHFKKDKVVIHSFEHHDTIASCLTTEVDGFSTEHSDFQVNADDSDIYKTNVSAAIQEIKTGDLMKAIISRAVELDGELDVLSTYQQASGRNNSVRSYAFELDHIKAVGCSPEILLYRRNGGPVETNPLAGTRKRGATKEEDLILRNELYRVSKEVKEHALSILLAQEELLSVCEKESVQICNFMETKPYRVVQHLSSRVKGDLLDGKSVYDALKIVFPGITVSGISKKEAIRCINKLEPEARGIYAGAIGWIDSKGDVDLSIAIRSAYQYADRLLLNAGAGIIEESNPEDEYTETVNKLMTIGNTIILL